MRNPRVLTRQFVSSQPECIPHNLLMQITLELEQDPADGHSSCPVIKTSFTLAHSNFVSFGVDSNVGTDSGIQPVALAS